MRQGHETGYTPLSRAKVKNGGAVPPLSQYVFKAQGQLHILPTDVRPLSCQGDTVLSESSNMVQEYSGDWLISALVPACLNKREHAYKPS
jgi:hypothetical protein